MLASLAALALFAAPATAAPLSCTKACEGFEGRDLTYCFERCPAIRDEVEAEQRSERRAAEAASRPRVSECSTPLFANGGYIGVWTFPCEER
jgi:hypothetical protein